MSDWSVATWEGLELAQARRVAAATPEQRMDWLEQSLQLAYETGALQRARRERQRACDELWNRTRPLQ